jgi:hypothetical protein
MKIEIKYKGKTRVIPSKGINIDDFQEIDDFTVKSGNTITILENFFSSKFRKIPNVYRHTVILKDDNEIEVRDLILNEISNSIFNDVILDHTVKDNSICLILESPHQSEYSYRQNCFCAISPAQKTTGKQIKANLPKILSKSISLGAPMEKGLIYNLLIINPVPFQTSLHFLHKKALSSKRAKGKPFQNLRDNVWKVLWSIDSQLEEEFIQILRDKEIKLILNSCTTPLKHIIEVALLKNDFNFLNAPHPSAWFHEDITKIQITNNTKTSNN